MNDDVLHVIWSIEHRGWWKPGGWGYTPTLQHAGRYTQAEAARIVAKANIVRVEEFAVPLTEAARWLAALPPAEKWVRIAPGVYDDGAGTMHLVVKELLEANGYLDTPENRQTILEVARELMMRDGITVIEDE
jgi:hypothetical protein